MGAQVTLRPQINHRPTPDPVAAGMEPRPERRLRSLASVMLPLLTAAVAVLASAPLCEASGVELKLRVGAFDPVVQSPPVLPASVRPLAQDYPTSTSIYIVQCTGPILQQWRDAIEASGAEILGYLPDFAYKVRVASEELKAIEDLPFVRWTGPVLPDFKVEPELLEAGKQARLRVAGYGPDGSGKLTEGDARVAAALAANEEVAWVEEYTEPHLCNNVARELMGVLPAWRDYGLYGSGQVIGVCDTGLDTGSSSGLSADFAGRLRAALAYGRSNDWSDADGHGTHVAGSALGSGALSGSVPASHNYANSFAGVAPEAALVFQSVLDDYGTLGGLSDYSFTDILGDAYDRGVRVHTNSWGESARGRYKILSQVVDDFCWQHPDMLILFAAGNDGVDVDWPPGVVDLGAVGAPATAKNCITIGASENLRTTGGFAGDTWYELWGTSYRNAPLSTDRTSDNARGMAAFSSRGPTLDGRIKPDLVAPGSNIVSSRSHDYSAGSGWGVYDSHYLYMGGTSMATPLAAGAAALVREYFVKRQSVANPSSALIKAAMINGAEDLYPGQFGTSDFLEISRRPNVVEGWGLVDVASAMCHDNVRTLAFTDYTAGLRTGQNTSYSFTVADSSVPLRFTLVWSDYPAAVESSVTLVNDLDLELTGPNGLVALGNGAVDRRNNVEGIDIAAPGPGIYTLRVRAYNVPQGPQPFALVTTGGFSSTVIRGRIADAEGRGVAGVQVTIGPSQVSTDADGNYALRVTAGTYTVTPSMTNWTFSPASRTLTVAANGLATGDFVGTGAAASVEGGVSLLDPVVIESPHPYGNNLNRVWTVQGIPGASSTSVYFDYIDLEQGYDFLYLQDAAGNTVQQWTGYEADVLSDSVPGSSCRLVLSSDYSVAYDGFRTFGVIGQRAGITVSALPGSLSAATDAAGHFRIDGLLPGSYTITPGLEGWAFYPVPEPIELAAGEVNSDIYFIGYPEAEVSGTVRSHSIDTVSQAVESPHPYTNNYSNTWTISAPAGATAFSLHFNYIETEDGYDYVEILDASGEVQSSYSGDHADLWSPWVRGGSVRVRLRSDSSFANYRGFQIDSYRVAGQDVPMAGVRVTASPGGQWALTNASGNYRIQGLEFGEHTITPSLASWTFDPPSEDVYLSFDELVTGVDFLALEPGCIAGRVQRIAPRAVSATVESPHPYSNGEDRLWTVQAPESATALRLHFATVDTEQDYDFLRVLSPSGSVLHEFTGFSEDVWTEWFDGSAVDIHLQADWSITAYGFRLDGYEYVTAGAGVQGASVTATKPAAAGGAPPIEVSAVTAADGTYSLTGLEAGIYEVRASAGAHEVTPEVAYVAVEAGVVTGDEVFYIEQSSPSNVSSTPGVAPLPLGGQFTVQSVYTDADGASDITGAYYLLNTALASANGVFLWYDTETDLLWMRDDSGSRWLGGSKPGTDSVIENSAARIYCGGTTAAMADGTLTVQWRLGIKSAMGGKSLQQWMYVTDRAKLTDGWEAVGSPVAVAVNRAPANAGLTPSSGMLPVLSPLVLTARHSDPEGAATLRGAYLLLNEVLEGRNGVYLWYDRSVNKLYLRDSANASWLGGAAPGSSQVLENDHCRLHCASTTVTADGNTLQISYGIEFKAAAGVRSLKAWMYAIDEGGLTDGWDQMGTLSVGSSGQPPLNLDVTPATGSLPAEAPQTLTSRHSDPNGGATVRHIYLLLNETLDGRNAVYCWLDQSANRLYLRDSANASWGTGVAPGTPVSLENSTCRLYCGETTVVRSGVDIAVNWRLEMKGAALGRTLKTWMYAIDDTGLRDGWDQAASYVIGASVLNISLSPVDTSVPTDVATTFTTRSLAPNGRAATSAYLLLNSAINPGGGVYLYYDGPSNRLYLRNDAGTGWLGGYAPGSANSISNRLVTVNCAASTATMNGGQLEVRSDLRFKPYAAGRQFKAWMYTMDDRGGKDGWDQMGVITVVTP